jgi:hypothetical protein
MDDHTRRTLDSGTCASFQSTSSYFYRVHIEPRRMGTRITSWITLEVEPFDFCIDLQTHSKAVCDGSVRNNKYSSFGWAIRDEAGNTVATGIGPAPGTKPSSYRAEAYGMLSIMRFLIRIAEYTEMSFQWQGVLGTDSQSFLDALSGKDRDPQEGTHPFQSMDKRLCLMSFVPIGMCSKKFKRHACNSLASNWNL